MVCTAAKRGKAGHVLQRGPLPQCYIYEVCTAAKRGKAGYVLQRGPLLQYINVFTHTSDQDHADSHALYAVYYFKDRGGRPRTPAWSTAT